MGGPWLLGEKIPMGCESSCRAGVAAPAKDENGGTGTDLEVGGGKLTRGAFEEQRQEAPGSCAGEVEKNRLMIFESPSPPTAKSMEADFVVWCQREQLLGCDYATDLVFGEAKRPGRDTFKVDDVDRIKLLAETSQVRS